MHKWLALLFIGLIPVAALAGSINPQGSSGAPVAVSTAVVEVAPCLSPRSSLQICNTGSQSVGTIGTNWLMCSNGSITPNAGGMACGAAGTGGTFAPTAAGGGQVIFPGTCQTFNTPDNATWNMVQAEWDCICSATNGCEAYVTSAP